MIPPECEGLVSREAFVARGHHFNLEAVEQSGEPALARLSIFERRLVRLQ
jgi:hypothetical protein